MINKGGIQLLYVQIRALANNAAKKALDKAGKKGLEKTVYSEMLEQLGKQLSQSAGRKFVPVIGGFIGTLFDTAYMARVLKYAKIVYHKRYLQNKWAIRKFFERVSRLSKLYAVYTIAKKVERFLGQAYLTEKDLQVIEQSFEGHLLQSEYLITLTDGDVVNINIIDSIEEIKADED